MPPRPRTARRGSWRPTGGARERGSPYLRTFLGRTLNLLLRRRFRTLVQTKRQAGWGDHRRRLLRESDVHTLPRLSTGIFYAGSSGVRQSIIVGRDGAA